MLQRQDRRSHRDAPGPPAHPRTKVPEYLAPAAVARFMGPGSAVLSAGLEHSLFWASFRTDSSKFDVQSRLVRRNPVRRGDAHGSPSDGGGSMT